MNLDYEECHNTLIDLANGNDVDVDISDGDLIRILAMKVVELDRLVKRISQLINWPQ